MTFSRYSGLCLVLTFIVSSLHASFCQQLVNLEKQAWIHGSDPCSENRDAGLQVVQYNRTSYIIRQNKCLNYEAPFLYLFIGAEKALLVDTGADAPDSSFPLYETVTKLLKGKDGKQLPLVIIHSHGHGDHRAGDRQFINKPFVRLVPPLKDSLINFFQLKQWPITQMPFNLGRREVIIIPVPGHDDLSIAVYDAQTKWLLTGDTIYPGRLYIRNWHDFRSSITRLLAFSKAYPVSYLMGNHIEMTSTKGLDYPTGTTYQPHEHVLPLGLNVLDELQGACEKMGDVFTYNVHDDFILVPK